MPSAPRSRTAAAACLAKRCRDVALRSRLAWVVAPALLQAKHERLSTTRLWFRCASLMIEVIFELVQPAQPIVLDPSGSRFWRFPEAVQPTLKYATVESVRQSRTVLLSESSQ